MALTKISYSMVTGAPINVFDYLSDAQKADVQSYGFTLDVSTAVQNAITAATTASAPLVVPAGGYLVNSTLTIPNSPKYGVFKMTGAGCSNPFAISASSGTTFKKTTTGKILYYVGAAVPPAETELDISGIKFWMSNSSNTEPVVEIDGFYGIGKIHNNTIWQAGTGNGLQIDYAAGILIDQNYVLNRDLVTTGLGASRVGIGIYIPNSYDSALITLTKNTSRGFLTAYEFGQNSTGGYIYSLSMNANECSLTTNGVVITNRCQGAVIQNGYFEGGDGGVAISDSGLFTLVSGNFSFPGYGVHISSGLNTYGGVYVNNVISISGTGSLETPNAVGIRLACTGVYSGLNRTCTGNLIVFGGSGGTTAGVVGLEITGANPKLNISSNTFNPQTWVGGAGTYKISDTSTNSTGAGSGVYGFGIATDGGNEYPYVGRGSYGVALSSTTLTQSNVSGNVLTIGEASDFVMLATAATTVNSITATNIENKLFWIRTTNANTTFANTANLKMSGSASYTPGANGASICFKCHSGICWEVSRVAY
jgi:hypothetical protein